MSSSDHLPDAAAIASRKCIIEEKKSEDDCYDATSEALLPSSLTLAASMSTLKNIDVSKSAPSTKLPTIASFSTNSGCSASTALVRPYETCISSSLAVRPNSVQSTALHQKTQHNTLRRGKWTPEEEEYANAVVREFNSGYLDAQAGTTLRIYLSEKLQCDPMRITKKFTGNDSIGKRVFHPTGRVGDGLTKEANDAQANLELLYQKWKRRLDYHDREYARKKVAAQAVSQASGYSGIIPRIHSADFIHSELMDQPASFDEIHATASWLSRATNITKNIIPKSEAEIEQELRSITCLIEESPSILAIVSDLARPKDIQLRQHHTSTLKRKSCMDSTPTDSPKNPMKLLASISSHAAPVPIIDTQRRYKSGSKPINRSASIGDLEDAQTFVRFLKSMS